MAHPYLPLLIVFLFAGIIVLSLLLIAYLLGPKRSSPVKGEPFESGNPPRGDARIKFSVKFYLVAMLFLIFDIEVVFLYPWAVAFKSLKLFGFIEMLVFIGILLVCYLYIWKRGGLEWD